MYLLRVPKSRVPSVLPAVNGDMYLLRVPGIFGRLWT